MLYNKDAQLAIMAHAKYKLTIIPPMKAKALAGCGITKMA